MLYICPLCGIHVFLSPSGPDINLPLTLRAEALINFYGMNLCLILWMIWRV